ncbi:MAG: hypothetical protein ABIH39_02345, partial [Candidatus Margulisiibacteriota bacterium]
MIKIISKILSITLVLIFIFTLTPAPAAAWEQGKMNTHEEINRQAVSRFFTTYASNTKYVNAAIDRSHPYLGPKVTSSSLLERDHVVVPGTFSFEEWVAHGGYSADESHIWASIRHFYDPLAVSGVSQLTDHSWIHSNLYDAISAKAWAFEDASNPYRWEKALEYYKRAMEITSDSKITVVPGTGFRDPDIMVKSPAEARDAYLGKAFRALGETMHMMADVTQPAHVRNDSHPTGDLDPLESVITKENVKMVKNSPVDPVIDGQINTAATAADMYEKIALFTNSNFYTDDTIYNKASGVNPRNGEKPYPQPQFNDFILDKLSSVKTYVKYFNGKPVPMIQETYLSYKLGSLWQSYQVPSSFAPAQAEVLIPIAIKANSKLINLFFPT